MSLKATYDKIILRMSDGKKMIGGLEIVGQNRNESGEIISVGQGFLNQNNPSEFIPTGFSVGEHVIIRAGSGSDIFDPETSEKLRIVQAQEIMAVIE